jgi:hypothetical protein
MSQASLFLGSDLEWVGLFFTSFLLNFPIFFFVLKHLPSVPCCILSSSMAATCPKCLCLVCNLLQIRA